jgi:hypothetical protein
MLDKKKTPCYDSAKLVSSATMRRNHFFIPSASSIFIFSHCSGLILFYRAKGSHTWIGRIHTAHGARGAIRLTKIETAGRLRLLLERGAVVCGEPSAFLSQPKQSAAIQPDERTRCVLPFRRILLAKEPGAEPFVQVGSKVKMGDTLCIIEAMKTMNDIRAPRKRNRPAILAADGATLAAGDALFMLSEETDMRRYSWQPRRDCRSHPQLQEAGITNDRGLFRK